MHPELRFFKSILQKILKLVAKWLKLCCFFVDGGVSYLRNEFFDMYFHTRHLPRMMASRALISENKVFYSG